MSPNDPSEALSHHISLASYSHNYPPDFLNFGDLYGYAVVSANSLRNDFVGALPAIANALKSAYLALETCRLHVEGIVGDEPSPKMPKSPRQRATLRSIPDLTTSYLYSTGKSSAVPTKVKLRKQLADITMMTGRFSRALEIYQSCLDYLSASSDPFWYASAAEGKIAASFLLLYPENADIPWNDRVKDSMMFFGPDNKTLEEMTDQLKDQKYVGVVVKQTTKNSRHSIDKPKDRRILSEEQMINLYHSSVFPYYERKSDGLHAWAESLLRRSQLKEHIGHERSSVRNSAIAAHKLIQEKRLPEHIKIRSNLVTANLLFQTNFIRQAAFYMFCATSDSALAKNSSKPLAGIRYIHQILPIHLVNLVFTNELPEESGGWAALHCHLFQQALIPCAMKLYSMEKRISKKLEFWYRSFLINAYYNYLSDEEVKNELTKLETHVTKMAPKYAPITITSQITLPPVQFTQLPQVRHFSIVRQSIQHLPRSRLATSNKSNTFMLHKRPTSGVNLKDEDPNALILWPKKESQHFVMVIHNPLPAKFHCRIQIAYKGAEVQLREITVDFEPKQTLQVVVDVLPVSSGEVEFTGYQLVSLGGYKCFVGTDKIAPKYLKDCYLKATIIEPVPLMRLKLGTAEVDQQIDVDLWCGEKTSALLNLTSEGKAKPKIVDLVLEGKSVKDYSDSMSLEWDKEGLKANGKANVKFEFLPPEELITAKTDKKMELKLTYQATPGSTYYRQHDILIHMHYYPLLCLKDVKVTPNEDVAKFSIRILLLNCSPHSVNVESNGVVFTVRSYSVARNHLTCRRSKNHPPMTDAAAWIQFINKQLSLQWTYQHRSGTVKHDPGFISRADWWTKVVNVPPMRFELSLCTDDGSTYKQAKSPIQIKQATVLLLKLWIKDCNLRLEEAHLQCVVGDHCENQPCNHVEADGTNFCVILGTDQRIIQVKRSSVSSEKSHFREAEEFSILTTHCGEFNLYFVLTPVPVQKEQDGKTPNDQSVEQIAYVSQKWMLQVSAM